MATYHNHYFVLFVLIFIMLLPKTIYFVLTSHTKTITKQVAGINIEKSELVAAVRNTQNPRGASHTEIHMSADMGINPMPFSAQLER